LFTEITQLHSTRTWDREHLWSVDEGAPVVFLAGAVLGSEIVRVRLLRAAQFREERYQLADGGEGTLPYHSWTVARGDEQWPTIGSERDRESLLEPYLQGFAYTDTGLRFTRQLTSGEHISGFAEHTGEMDRRAASFPLWNIDPPIPYGLDTETMYTSIPFGITTDLDNGRSYGILINSRVIHDVIPS
jgi:Galactose mutarotase-like